MKLKSVKPPNPLKELLGTVGLTDNPNIAKNYMRNYFNVYNRTLVDVYGTYEFSYVFITRPELYLFEKVKKPKKTNDGEDSADTKLNIGKNLSKSKDLSSIVKQDRELYKYLDSNIDMGTNFLIPMINYLDEMSITDVEFRSKSSPKNAHNIKIEYPTNYEASLAGIPVNLTFTDDNENTIMNLLNVWSTYMSEISLGKIYPRPKVAYQNKFESSCAIYQFVTQEDGETIKFYAKWTGCYPQNIPFSNESHKRRKDANEALSVSFYAPFFKAMKPRILAEFNLVSGFRRNFEPNNNNFPSYNYLNPQHRDIDDYFMDKVGVIKDPNNDKLKLRFYNSKRFKI